MKSIHLKIPKYKNWVFSFNWEEWSKIITEIDLDNSKSIYIKWNKEWLLSLANHLINLSQDDVPNNEHFHLDEYNWWLVKWSIELIIEKDNKI